MKRYGKSRRQLFDELDRPALTTLPNDRFVYGDWTKATRTLLDPGGVAVEDLAAADLNGDGKIDLIAVGRQTGNVRIYWNQGK